jgi:Leucine-rich repeat (LRR) protein
LTRLDLAHNRLNWTIPNNLNGLARLQELKLSANYLAGPIPESLNALRALTNLSLANNELSGIVPALTSLRSATIDLTGNRLDIEAGSASISNIQATIDAGNKVKYQPQVTIATDAPKFAKPRKKPAPPSAPRP